MATDTEGILVAPSLIALTGLVYAWVAVDLAWRGRYDLAIAYAGYALANVGLYSVAKN